MELSEDLQRAIAAGGKPIILRKAPDNRKVVICRVPNTNLESFANPPFTLIEGSDSHYRLTDTGSLQWVGKKENSSSLGNSFLLSDMGTHYTLMPLSGRINFSPDTEAFGGNLEVDEIEKRRKIEASKDAQIKIRLTSETGALVSGTSKRESESLTPGAMKKEKLRKVLKRKHKEKDLDGQAQATSSLAVGHIRKAQCDWDYDEKDMASDDEEGAGGSSEDDQNDDEHDVSDSEEEKDDVVLTTFGESLSRLLNNQKEREADAELDQFSDDEDEPKEGQTENQIGGPSSSLVNRGANLTPTAVRAVDQTANGNKDQAGDALKNNANPRAREAEAVKESIVALLAREKDVTVKFLLRELDISAKNAKFDLVKNIIGEICQVVQTTAPDGTVLKVLQLKKSTPPS